MDPFPPAVVQAAQASQAKWNIPAAIILAQWSLESAFGQATPPGSNNPFGIKATAGEPFVIAQTTEYVNGKRVLGPAKFRKFDSMADAFDQHGKLLATAPCYAKARLVSGDPDAFARALQGIYATDPQYANKLIARMKQYNLYKYDLVRSKLGPLRDIFA
jgi:flagellum-specific peptidoglycan hydrolase FlgJ